MAAMHTCITCGVQFKSPEIQRLHYKTDWHRYNLKRKVAGLSYVTANDFAKLVIEQKAAVSEEKYNVHCKLCSKVFTSEKSYENHVQSKKHQARALEEKDSDKIMFKYNSRDVKKELSTNTQKSVEDQEEEDIETDSEIEELSSDEWDEEEDEANPINKNNCLFCNHHSRNFTNNLKHMTVGHSFFVPDVEYCVDVIGLLRYLGSKVIHGHMCLWCSNNVKSFGSAVSAQKHMIDKGHCKIFYENDALAEYADFYDYSSSYPDNEIADPDEELDDDISVLDDSDYQLTLPSGAVIGHRTLMRYYKQNLSANKAVAVRNKVSLVLANYKMLGYTPLQKEIAQRKAKDIKYMQRLQQKFAVQIGWKANKLQKHFRPQINF